MEQRDARILQQESTLHTLAGQTGDVDMKCSYNGDPPTALLFSIGINKRERCFYL
jgi:hypothetical protein